MGIAATPDGGGYWLVAADGGIFTFADAPFYGSPLPPTTSAPPNSPVVGIAATLGGYAVATADGGVCTFGYGVFGANCQTQVPNNHPLVAITPA